MGELKAVQYKCICKTQIDVQFLIDVKSSNPCPISTSQTSQVYVLFSNSQVSVQFSNLWPFRTFSNQRPMAMMTSLKCALTNKLAINLRILKKNPPI